MAYSSHYVNGGGEGCKVGYKKICQAKELIQWNENVLASHNGKMIGQTHVQF